MKKLDCAGQVATKMSDLRGAVRGVTMYSLTNNQTMRDKNTSGALDTLEAIKGLLVTLEKEGVNETERAAVETLRTALPQWRQAFDEIVELCKAGKPMEGDLVGLNKMKPVIESMQSSAAALARTQRETADAAVTGVASNAGTGTTLLTLLGIFGLAVSGVVWFAVTGVTNTLRRIAGTVAEQSENVAGAAAAIESSSQTLAQASTEQAASLEETSASCLEINSISIKNAEMSESAARVAAESGKKHVSAGGLLGEMETSMQKIKTSSDKVSHVLKVVDEIAFQTNILALNAAVEAARAGEAGLGFAVVADEVRNLAQKCAAAAQETSALIEQSITLSAEGNHKVQDVSQAMHGLLTDAKEIQSLVEHVQAASRDQSKGTEQISTAINQIEQVTMRVAAQAEESAAAGKQLAQQSSELNTAVEELARIAG